MLGDPRALVAVVACSFALLGRRDRAVLAPLRRSCHGGGRRLAAPSCASAAGRSRFRRRSPARVLRQKEWTLLARDPWLVSQTLMQILYLLPPALLLWVTFRDGTGAYVVLIPVVVMAAGQLAGGLAWLSISGEDAPDLVATAPIAAAPRPAGQDRSGDRRDRAGVRADRGGAGLRLAVRRFASRRSAS